MCDGDHARARRGLVLEHRRCVTGGVVVRDRAVPALYGRDVFGDFCKGRIYSDRLAGRRAREVRLTRLSVSSLSSFGQDGRGRVYATLLDGAVYRIAAR